jgi:hypothetical protein
MKRVGVKLLLGISVVLLVGGLFFTSARSQSVVEEEVPSQSMQVSGGNIFGYQGRISDAAGTPITNPALSMTFRLYAALTGGDPCAGWSETQSVNVDDGHFHVNIGSVSAIPESCLVKGMYLELTINGETLVPRELLTDAWHVPEADTLPDGATTRGALKVDGDLTVGALGYGEGGEIRLVEGEIGNDWRIDNLHGKFRLHHDGHVYLSVNSDGDVVLDGSLDMNDNMLKGIGIGAASMNIGVETPGDNNVNFDLKGGDTFVFRDYLGSTPTNIMAVVATTNGAPDKHVSVYGNLILHGSCTASVDTTSSLASVDESCSLGSIVSGAYVEGNLLNGDERLAPAVARFEKGDLLCWSAKDQQLELCDTANDRLVQAVADDKGKPIVLGAEPVKVIGPVVAGDILVSSDMLGYAMVNNNPAPGTVIGQALQDFVGDSGLIKAMIRKW